MSAKAPGIFESRLPDLEQSRALAREILAQGECLTLRDLALSGEDLKAMGMTPGPEMGKLLHRMLDLVLEGKVENTLPALKVCAQEFFKESE